MSQQRIGLALSFILSTSVPVCAQSNVSSAFQSTLSPGWECLQGPNELDRPGRTFYVDRNGVRYELADLHGRLKPIVGEVSSIAARTSGYVSAGLMAKILHLGGMLSISGSTTYATAVALFQRQEVRTEEADVRAALRTLDPSLIDSENAYFVIRNVQLARQMRLTVDRGIAGAFGGEAPFRAMFQVSGAAKPPGAGPSNMQTQSAADPSSLPVITAEDNKNFTIDQTFDKPLTVCFLAQKFTLKNVVGGAGGSIRDAQLIEEYWNPTAAQ